MRKLIPIRLAVAVLLAAAVAGCSADATAPVPAAPNTSLVGGLLGTVTGLLFPVRALTRTAPLEAPITVSAVIGSAGGSFTIPEAGLTVVVPAGAVYTPTAFSATALAGNEVAYEFEPHGTRFPRALTMRQRLAGTTATSASQLQAAYFANHAQIQPLLDLALVNELLGVVLDAGRTQASFSVSHFSGYMLSTGRR